MKLLACVLLIMTVFVYQADARRHHRHYHYHVYHYDNRLEDVGFCRSIRDAFSNLSPAELGRFVALIPKNRKTEASRCLERWPESE